MAARSFASGGISDAFIAEIPKTDLHVHLDGSVRVETVCELAAEAGIKLPADTPDGLRAAVYRPEFSSLEEYLETFATTNLVTQTAAQLERIAYEFACDNYDEGVRYFEVRYAPQLHAGPGFNCTEVMQAVDAGLKRATAEYNAKAAAEGDIVGVPFKYGTIVCALRMIFPGMSRYYDAFWEMHKHEGQRRIQGLASMALVTEAVEARDRLGLPIVSLDIAGAEAGFPAVDHKHAFEYAHKHWMNKTVHAGEGYGPESIFQAITDLHAHRIGHGYHLFSADHVRAESGIEDAEDYVHHLSEHCAEHRVTMEVCMTSNRDTMPWLREGLEKHALGKMIENNVAATICTDNRTVSSTTMCREIRLAVDTFDLSPAQLQELIMTGFKRNFFPGTYKEKRAYLAQAVEAYRKCEERHGLR